MSPSVGKSGVKWWAAALGGAVVALGTQQISGLAWAGDEVRPPAHRCGVFEVDVSRRSVVETSDPTTEVGQWIAEQRGWVVDTLDFEVGQKPTDYPQGWMQVCLVPASPVEAFEL